MDWIEIPAQRILGVTMEELCELFDLMDGNGLSLQHYKTEIAEVKLFRRRRDGKLFRRARMVPVSAAATMILYLEEM
jgi:hypothetical protein